MVLLFTGAHSTAAYNEIIEKIELINKILSIGLWISGAIILSTAVPYSFVRYYIFDMGEDSFYLFLPAWFVFLRIETDKKLQISFFHWTRFPFEWRTPFGYFVAWLSQCAGTIAGSCANFQFLNLLFGSCWLFMFIAEDITQDVIAFNNMAKTASNENCTELIKRFCDMVQIYSDVKQ